MDALGTELKSGLQISDNKVTFSFVQTLIRFGYLSQLLHKNHTIYCGVEWKVRLAGYIG